MRASRARTRADVTTAPPRYAARLSMTACGHSRQLVREPKRSELEVSKSRPAPSRLRSRSAARRIARVFDSHAASPSVTTRRTPGLSSPTQMGGCGRPLGANPRAERRTSPRRRVVLRPRLEALAPSRDGRVVEGHAENLHSSLPPPPPTTQIRRRRRRELVSILAMTTGWRWPRMNTEAPMRARVVTAAAAVSAITASR